MITFNYVTWKNLLSYGNEKTRFDFHNDLTLIKGSNSAGKSTLLDAVCYGLFGKPFRKVNKGQLVNTKSAKDCVVEVSFNIEQINFIIRRGLNPTFIEVIKDGGVLASHSSLSENQAFIEKYILKIDYHSFKQIVIIGKASYTSFMELSLAQRRQFIENILDLSIYGKMLEHHKKVIVSDELKIEKLSMEHKSVTDKIKYITKHHETNTQDYKLECEALKQQLQLLRSQQSKSTFVELQPTLVKTKKLLQDTNFKLSKLEDREKLLTENSQCPLCHQQIDKAFKETHLKEYTKNKEILSKIKQDLELKIAKLEDEITQFSLHNDEIHNIEFRIKEKQHIIDNTATVLHESVEELEKEKKNIHFEKNRLTQQLKRYKMISNLLGDDGIKKEIIKFYIPLMNDFINKFINQLDLFAHFELKENFDDQIIYRGQKLNYFSLSEGEKQKIDLGILLAWRHVLKFKSKFNCNLLIFDELLDGSIDSHGMDEFIKIVCSIKDSDNLSINVITHSNDQYVEFFNRQIVASKDNMGYSRMVPQVIE
jgi:DNA repair exonuclease SbcCD ATPase subunit